MATADGSLGESVTRAATAGWLQQLVTLPSARRAHRRTEPRALNATAPLHDAPASNHQNATEILSS